MWGPAESETLGGLPLPQFRAQGAGESFDPLDRHDVEGTGSPGFDDSPGRGGDYLFGRPETVLTREILAKYFETPVVDLPYVFDGREFRSFVFL